jgi:flagellar biogenesis protein FliO
MNSSADKGAASSDSLITWGIGESAKSIFKAVGAFILVLVLLIICLKIIGSLARGRAGAKGARAFSLRGTMALDNRRYLAAVEVDGHLVIVGVSPEGLRGLASWVLEEEPLDFQTEVNSAAAPAGLKDKLELESSLAAPRKSLADNGQLTEPALALDEEPFEGPQTNDDFLQIDVKKDK